MKATPFREDLVLVLVSVLFVIIEFRFDFGFRRDSLRVARFRYELRQDDW